MSTAPTYKPLEIEVTDFGPIAKAKLDLRPLTVFVGPSNTGKSYLATLIYALHRFFGGDTSNPEFTSTALIPRFYPRIFSSAWSSRVEYQARSKMDIQAISKEECDTLIDWVSQMLAHAKDEGYPEEFCAILPDAVTSLLLPVLENIETHSNLLGWEVARCFGTEDMGQLVRQGSRVGSKLTLKRHVSGTRNSLEPLTYTFATRGNGSKLSVSFPKGILLKIKCNDIDPWYRRKIQKLEPHINVSKYYGYRRPRVVESLRGELADVVAPYTYSPLDRVAHYMPADRAGVMHTHRVVVASLIQQSSSLSHRRVEPLPALSGVHADFLEQLIRLGDAPAHERNGGWLIPQKLESDILNGKVYEKQSEAGYTSFTYQPEGSKKEIPLRQSSSMVSELAPVVVYLRNFVQPGDVLIIEEPESHLHPGMQAAFTRQLAGVVRAGVRVIITTHSDYVLEELANLVRMSELLEEERAGLSASGVALRSDEVGVWLFEPRKRPKGTVVREIKLDTDSGSFPAGYGDVTEALYNKWVEIDSRIEENKSNQ